MKTPHPDHRGIAIIVVILMIAIIVPVTLQFNRTSRSAVYEASHMGNGMRTLYVAKSGFNIGQAVLLAQKAAVDTLTQDWANLGETSALSKTLFDNASFQLLIEDESGKIPLNAFMANDAINPDVQEMLMRFLSLPEFSLGTEKASAIVHSLKDWMDKDDAVTDSGAETVYYKGMATPYAAKNAPMENLEELLMIKGVTKALYYGTKETPGLKTCLTLHGSGKININTAPKLVLRVLAKDMTAQMTEEMDTYRRNPQNDLSNPAWFRRINSMANIAVNLRWITTRSDRFHIQSTGYIDQMAETVSGVVYRDPNKISLKLMSWKAY